jgi:hypothetical protein
MTTRRINPRAVKLHRSYNVPELAICFGVHRNTIRQWQRDGLSPIDKARPILFQGATVQEFLLRRNKKRKRPCPTGTLYCFRCREPRKPALNMADFVPVTALWGNVRALCETCETLMNRRAQQGALTAILPNCDVRIVEGELRLKRSALPSLNSAQNRKANR